MKREILFKAKKKDTGGWVTGFFYLGDITAEGKPTYIIEYDGESHIDEHEVHPETVSQFTGIRDKNGDRIFENYILNHIDGYGKITVLCKYNHNGFVFNSKQLGNINPYMINEFEIMGNRFDNPELLES